MRKGKIIVASMMVLCVLIFVAAAAWFMLFQGEMTEPTEEEKQAAILHAAGLMKSETQDKKSVETLYHRYIIQRHVNLDSGELVAGSSADTARQKCEKLAPERDPAQVRQRCTVADVFFVKDKNNEIQQFIDPDVRLISYSTRHPKHDMQHLLKEVDKMLQLNVDERPLICGVGLGGYWAERIGFLCDIRQVIFNPNLFPYENMEGKIDRPEEYADIATKCVTNFREKNRDRCLVILSRNDEALNSQRTSEELHHYYEIVWDEEQTHKFKNISPHLQRIKAFKTLG